MSREIKFRVWSSYRSKMIEWGELLNLRAHSVFNMCQPELPLMQYTGLKDCNGVDIYEGDILECPDNQRYEVVFENGSFGIAGFDYDDHWYPEEFLLVGNIHQHPELLK